MKLILQRAKARASELSRCLFLSSLVAKEMEVKPLSKRMDQLKTAVEKATQKQHSAEQEKKRYLAQLRQLERNERMLSLQSYQDILSYDLMKSGRLSNRIFCLKKHLSISDRCFHTI